jgi:hypothetical protein
MLNLSLLWNGLIGGALSLGGCALYLESIGENRMSVKSGTAFLVASLLALSPSVAFAGASVPAPATASKTLLAPGGAAGVQKAQTFSNNTLWWVAGAVVVGGGIALIAGGSNGHHHTSSTTTTSP